MAARRMWGSGRCWCEQPYSRTECRSDVPAAEQGWGSGHPRVSQCADGLPDQESASSLWSARPLEISVYKLGDKNFGALQRVRLRHLRDHPTSEAGRDVGDTLRELAGDTRSFFGS